MALINIQNVNAHFIVVHMSVIRGSVHFLHQIGIKCIQSKDNMKTSEKL